MHQFTRRLLTAAAANLVTPAALARMAASLVHRGRTTASRDQP